MNKIRERSRSPNGFVVYISNLPLSFPQPRLFSMFSRFGDVRSIKMNLPDASVTLKTESSFKESLKCLSHQGWSVSSIKKDKSINDKLSKSHFPDVYIRLKLVSGMIFPTRLSEITIYDRTFEPISEKICGIMVLTAEDKAQEILIKEYIEFYNKNNKIGFGCVGNDVIIILPSGKLSEVYYSNLGTSQLLALYVKREISSSMKSLQEFLENRNSKDLS